MVYGSVLEAVVVDDNQQVVDVGQQVVGPPGVPMDGIGRHLPMRDGLKILIHPPPLHLLGNLG